MRSLDRELARRDVRFAPGSVGQPRRCGRAPWRSLYPRDARAESAVAQLQSSRSWGWRTVFSGRWLSSGGAVRRSTPHPSSSASSRSPLAASRPGKSSARARAAASSTSTGGAGARSTSPRALGRPRLEAWASDHPVSGLRPVHAGPAPTASPEAQTLRLDGGREGLVRQAPTQRPRRQRA